MGPRARGGEDSLTLTGTPGNCFARRLSCQAPPGGSGEKGAGIMNRASKAQGEPGLPILSSTWEPQLSRDLTRSLSPLASRRELKPRRRRVRSKPRAKVTPRIKKTCDRTVGGSAEGLLAQYDVPLGPCPTKRWPATARPGEGDPQRRLLVPPREVGDSRLPSHHRNVTPHRENAARSSS